MITYRNAGIIAVVLLFSLFLSCSDKEEKITVDPAFGAYISGYTSGVISSRETIRILLTEPYSGPLNLSAPLPDDIFYFSPEIQGQAVWLDAQTIHFQPEKPLPGGSTFNGEMKLSQLLEVPEELENFVFQFQTIEQNFSVFTDGYSSYNQNDLTRIQYKGKVQTADVAELEDISRAFTATQGGDEKEMIWKAHSSKVFSFTVEDVSRQSEKSTLMIQWDGSELSSKNSGEKEIEIPSLGDFKVINTSLTHEPEQLLTLHFSDPIAEQSLEGLITIEDAGNLSFTIDGHVVQIFPDSRLGGHKLLQVQDAIRNIADHKMSEPYSQSILFEQEKPAIRIADHKSIMPRSEVLTLPFEAVSLKAVDVYVTKVFTNNILQFFQSNELGGTSQITYVGRHIYRKHVDLRQAAGGNLHTWGKYHLDISDIVEADPGAIYKVEIRFKKDYAVYPCNEDVTENDNTQSTFTANDGWTTDGTYFVDDYWSGYQYDWENMDNPCHAAYYQPYSSRSSITVMGSDMGLTAKMGGDNEMLVVVNDLLSTEPIRGAEVKIYDLQQQVIANGKTDKEGFAAIAVKGKPFVVVAEKGSSKSYLKVDEYSALSLSKFDVAGASVQDGVKGYIYGERGVWRPGDSLYLNLVVEDKMNVIPDRHPVKMELHNPRGQLVQQTMRTRSVNGFYDFRTATDADAITGNYQATFSIGNRRFSKTLKIETVKPNRLKINFEFDKELITGTDEIRTPLEVRWLHGAKASGLKADVNMTLRPSKTTFSKWKDYHFDNNLEYRGDSEPVTIFDGILDSQGRTEISADLSNKTENAPGILKVAFHTKAYEPGGNFSEDFHSVKFSPYETYAGMRIPEGEMWGGALETDQEHSIELVSVNEQGEASNRKSLVVTLYKLNRRWWYDSYNGNNFNFLNSSSYQQIETETVSLSAGKGNYSLSVPKNDWGRFVVVAKDTISGHSTADFIYFDWPYWMRANRTDSEASTILGFSSDKDTYAPGEKIKLTFPSPDNGRALVCIENGTRILEKFWIETESGETQVEVDVTEDMAPNVFAHIALLQPHAQTVNDRPMRMFGLIPLYIENPDTRLEPVLDAPQVFRPESTAEISVSEKSGKAMTYTLSVVDEGLLDLTRFKTPNPWDAFYAPEALGVRTWDMYDQVIGAMGENVGTLLSIGGDEEAVDPSQQKAMRFKPMVRHLGPYSLKPGEKTTHRIDIPNYIGSVRAMVVAGMEPAYGNTEKAIPVRSPLMVLGTLPRVLGPGEQVKLPVNLFAMESHVKDVKVTVRTNDLISGKENQQQYRFDQTGDALLLFDLKVGEKTGVAKVTIEATSGKETSVHEIELQVRSPNPAYTTVRDTVLFAGDQWNGGFSYFGIEGTNKAVLELSKLPAINLEKRMDYLIQYPHGCLEQITSAAFPQLYLHRLISLNSDRQMRISENINSVLRQYRNYQNASGGLAYWPGNGHVNDWATNYAGHLMLEAEAAGHQLPAGLKSQWLKYQQAQARSWSANPNRTYGYQHRTQAYRLYTLALAKEPDLGAMNLLRSANNLNLSARWLLALAYTEAGQPEVARKLIADANRDIPEYVELSYTFGSNLRDEAIVLQTLVKLEMWSDAAEVAQSIAEKMGSERWFSTQTTAYCLSALSAFMGNSSRNDGLKASIVYNNSTDEIATGKSMVQKHLDTPGGKGNVQVTNQSEQPLFCRLLVTGQPLEGKVQRQSKNISMKLSYLDNNLNEIDPSKLKMGTDFIAEVVIHNPGTRGDLQEMALIQVFPSGWEILNPRMRDDSGNSNSVPNYQDIRDDRVMTYFDMARNKTLTYRIRLNATYAGRYYLPAVLCNAMYDESIIATEPGKWVEVVE